MLVVRNPAGFEFEWPDGSPYVEVFHPDASFAEIPVVAIYAGDRQRNESSLKRIANEDPTFSRPW